jgi:glutathionyl-hydroquinone reductase
MKTFIAVTLAAVAFTADITDEIDREIQRDVEKFEDWERQAESQGSYEADKEAANFYRNLSCWWAGVEPVVDRF